MNIATDTTASGLLLHAKTQVERLGIMLSKVILSFWNLIGSKLNGNSFQVGYKTSKSVDCKELEQQENEANYNLIVDYIKFHKHLLK